MKSYTVEAFVLRLRPLGEADRILTLFSRERGKLSAVAKGSRKTRSRFGARLDFFSRAEITLHAGRSLDIVTGVRASAPAQARSAWERLVEPEAFALASYVAEMIDAFCEPGLAVPDLYDLLCETHDAIVAGFPAAALAPAVDLKLLQALGVALELDACARCGTPLGDRPLAGGRARLSPASGGLVCRRCGVELDARSERASEGATLRASGAELRALQSLRATPLAAAAEHPQLAALRRLTRPFVEYQLGRRSKALSSGESGRAEQLRSAGARRARTTTR